MRWYQVRYFPIHPYSCIPRLASFRDQRSTKPLFGHIIVFVTPAFYFSLNPSFYSFRKNREDVSLLFCDLTSYALLSNKDLALMKDKQKGGKKTIGLSCNHASPSILTCHFCFSHRIPSTGQNTPIIFVL